MVMATKEQYQRLRIMFFECGEFGGSVRCQGDMIEGLSALGCEIGLVSHYRKTGPVDLDSLDCIQRRYCLDLPAQVRPRPDVATRTFGIPHPTRFGMRYFRLAWRAIREFRPDVVYLNNGPGTHLPALTAARMLRVPVVCHLRMMSPLGPIDRFCLPRIKQFITLTRYGRLFYADQGIPSDKLLQLYDPFSVDEFDARTAEPHTGPVTRDGTVYVVQVGALRELKRPELAIEAFSIARRECPELKLVLAGDGPMRDCLETLILDRRLQGVVHLVGQCDNIAALLSRCHIGLHLSRSEGMGLILLEFKAAGLPIVTWNHPVMVEMVENGKCGIVTDGARSQVIAQALVTLCKSPELRKKMGQAGRRSVVDGRFSPGSHALRLRDMLTEVLAGQA